ncbi:MAG: sulfurtransferase TusA family protein [Proteobacteria bacterium]|nr:sulfurtransferase TusA family protein [Pseudomonadota bacterium]MBU1716554.1 sulfurtransferase TusA family protein [Pseudomonadota bacterium]
MKVDKEIDVLHKVCPLPLITLAKEVRTMAKGQVVKISGDDPIFEDSVLDFCREGEHEILENNREGRQVSIVFKI